MTNVNNAFQATVDQLTGNTATASFNEGTYERTLVEMGSKLKVVEAKAEKAAKKEKAPKVAKEKTVSKREQVAALYAASADKSRKHMLEVIMQELNVTKANASVYFYHVSK
jgi:uncharacterized protein YaiL (DUF2058 family)